MELLGNYRSELRSNYYQQLLALLNAAIANGELASGSAFDKSTVLALEQQAQTFAALPTSTAGARATDDSFNYPLSLLQARLNALKAEAGGFTTVSGRLLDILRNEIALIDELLAADVLAQWVASLPSIHGAWSSAWDFGIGQGAKARDLAPVDPSNMVEYSSPVTLRNELNCTSDPAVYSTGLRPAVTAREFRFKSLRWDYPEDGTVQTLEGPDLSWTQLDLLQGKPSVSYSAEPAVQTVLPQDGTSVGVFEFVGNVTGGVLPTYVRTLFKPRLNGVSAVVEKHVDDSYVDIQLSSCMVDPNSVLVVAQDGSNVYSLITDFTCDPNGSITPVNIPEGTELNISFKEYWPAYQCSTDQVRWSQVTMLDVDRLVPDDAVDLPPVVPVDGRFPMTDELGAPTGVYFRPLQRLKLPYLLLVTTPAGASAGPRAVLTLDVSQPGFLNAMRLTPFAALPCLLEQVEVEGLTSSTRKAVFSGDLKLDSPLTIRFDRQIVSRVYLTLLQPNYTVKEYQEESADALRRNTMVSLQSALPVVLRTTSASKPTTYRGYQYEFGFEDLKALDLESTTPTVFVQGPSSIPGCPELVSVDLDANVSSVFLCYRAYDASGTLLDENLLGDQIQSGVPLVFPFALSLDRSKVARTDVYLRFVFRTADEYVSRYRVQAALR